MFSRITHNIRIQTRSTPCNVTKTLTSKQLFSRTKTTSSSTPLSLSTAKALASKSPPLPKSISKSRSPSRSSTSHLTLLQTSPSPSSSSSSSKKSYDTTKTSLDRKLSDGKLPGSEEKMEQDLESLAEQERYDHIITRFARYTRRGGVWNNDLCRYVMNACLHATNIDTVPYAEKILNMMIDNGIKPSGEIYAMYMDAAMKCEQTEQAREIWHDLLKQDDMYNQSIPVLMMAMMNAAIDGEHGNRSEFLEIMDLAVKAPPSPVWFSDMMFWELFISTAEKHKWYDLVVEYGKRLQKGGSHEHLISQLQSNSETREQARHMLDAVHKARLRLEKQQATTAKVKVKVREATTETEPESALEQKK